MEEQEQKVLNLIKDKEYESKGNCNSYGST